MDPAGGSAYQELSTSQLLSVPYALHANTVQTGDNWGADAVHTDATLSGNGTASTPLLIANNGVTSAKIQNGAVTSEKLANNSVTTDKINSGAVTGAKISQAGATAGQALKWNGSAWSPANDETDGGLILPFSGTGTSGGPLFHIVNLGTSGSVATLSNGNYAIWGESANSTGIGVYGVNKTSTGTTYGVFGDVYSSTGYSGYFQGGRFFIQGNTGIGTQNPGSKLEVAGQVKITGGSPGAGKVLTSDATGLASWLLPESTWLKNGSNLYYNSGNVGVGLDNPEGMLEIYGNSVDHYPHLFLSEADGYARISFRTMTTPAKHWILAGHTNETDGDSQWHLNYNNGTTGKNLFSVYGDSRIAFDGKVGIGKIDPEAPLQVHSNITYSSGITPIFKISDNFKTWNIGLGVSGDRFSIASEDLAERLTILKTNGNVGIGTTSPGTKLEVAGQVKITGGSPGSGKVLTSDASGVASWQTPQPVTWLKNGSDIYYNTGNVAIGMTFPRYALTIYQDTDPRIGFYNSTSGTSGTDGFTISTGATGSPVWIWNWENSNMHFGTNNTNRMIIDADGHVSMMRYLDLNTDGTFGALYVKGKQALWWDGTYFSWGYDATYNYFARPVTIGDPANHTSYMLYVKGNAYTTGSWGSSDVRFKKNISSIDNSLHRVMKVHGVSFEFRNDKFRDYQFAEGRQFGFIAQELEREFPEVVKTESDGYKSVNYNGMIPVLLEAIKEQQKMIKNLKTDNENLNTRLEKLEKMFSVSASNNE
jgi:ribosomal protein S6E (S10)